MIMTTTTTTEEERNPERMTKQELIEYTRALANRVEDYRVFYETAKRNAEDWEARAKEIEDLVLFDPRPDVPGGIYRVAYPNTIDVKRPVLYAGRLEFTVSTVLDAENSMHRLKKGHEKHFDVAVGIYPGGGGLIALNRPELPPHPNIGDFICLGGVSIFESDDPRKLTESVVRRTWEANRERIAATLSTANVQGGFHNAIVDRVYLDAGTYEGEAMTQANGSSPVWAACRESGCGGTEDVCIECGRCGDHCDGITCGACGEKIHDGALCSDCGQCDNCGHADDCESSRGMEECEHCGGRSDIEDMHQECGLCNGCHHNAGHGYCVHCNTHLTDMEVIDCGLCSECHGDAGHAQCDECGTHLDDDEGVMCEECSVTVCDDHTVPRNSGMKEVAMCPSCAEMHDKAQAHTAGQTSVTDTVWHQ